MNNWWGSIREKTEQIKAYYAPVQSDLFAVLLILFVGLSAFGLGRLSAYERLQPPVQVTTASAVSGTPMTIGGLLVASRNGTKYHYPWCSGAQRMSEENKVWFASEEEARAAGYEPAGNCKGLK